MKVETWGPNPVTYRVVEFIDPHNGLLRHTGELRLPKNQRVLISWEELGRTRSKEMQPHHIDRILPVHVERVRIDPADPLAHDIMPPPELIRHGGAD